MWTAPTTLIAPGPPVYDPWFGGGQRDVKGWWGADGEGLFLPGEVASGSVTDKIGGVVIGPPNTPDYKQTLVGGGGDPKGCGFSGGSQERLIAPNNTAFNPSTGSFCALFVHRAWSLGGTSIIGNARFGIAGWKVYNKLNDGIMFLLDSGPPITVTALHPGVGVPCAALVWRNTVTGTFGITPTWRAEVSAADTSGSIASTDPFAIGAPQSGSAASGVVGPVIIWRDANARHVYDNRVANMAAWKIATGL
jgi:hypothetical protein